MLNKTVDCSGKWYLYTGLQGWSYHMGHLMGKKGSRGMPCAELASNVAQQAGFAIKGFCILHKMTAYAKAILVLKHAMKTSLGVRATSSLGV